jgi:glycerol-3-phosphate acyltransferase PlsY
MKYLFCIISGYLVGMINPSYILGKRHGVDVRREGSGNAGASNALILFGKVRGFLCAVFDIAKAVLVVRFTSGIFPGLAYAFPVTAAACILGHIFPFYLKFKGGKGLACLGGVILAFDWRVFLVLLAVEAVIAFSTQYICFVPMTASVVFSAVYGVMRQDLIGALIMLGVALVICWKHKENVKRIRQGIELRLRYLWNRNGEVARLKANLNDEQTKKAKR